MHTMQGQLRSPAYRRVMFTNLFSGLGNIEAIIVRIIPALICITFHELAHGYTAYRLGDRTAKDMGRLTLNPIKHIDIFGLLMMILVRFGWAKPVPVNMNNFKNPRTYMAITAFAGPLSNIILALLVMFLYGFFFRMISTMTSPATGAIIHDIIQNTVFISIALAIFNMMPIPPLDGSKILFSLLPEDSYYKLMRYERFGFILLLLVLTTDIFQNTIGRLTNTLFNSFLFVWQTSFSMVN